MDFEPSKLGTKEHWDDLYEQELANFEEIGDEGEVWFGRGSEKRMIEWALKYHPPSTQPTILEVGSGNGSLLFGLLKAGYPPTCLIGIDYSGDGVRLARSIAASPAYAALGAQDITFAECNILRQTPPRLSHMKADEGYDVVMDKGTFDAMALGQKNDAGQLAAEVYPDHINRLLKRQGRFLVTSCNFTEADLKNFFIHSHDGTVKTGFTYHSNIIHPATFVFGGQWGSPCSSVAFSKEDEVQSATNL